MIFVWEAAWWMTTLRRLDQDHHHFKRLDGSPEVKRLLAFFAEYMYNIYIYRCHFGSNFRLAVY